MTHEHSTKINQPGCWYQYLNIPEEKKRALEGPKKQPYAIRLTHLGTVGSVWVNSLNQNGKKKKKKKYSKRSIILPFLIFSLHCNTSNNIFMPLYEKNKCQNRIDFLKKIIKEHTWSGYRYSCLLFTIQDNSWNTLCHQKFHHV